MVGCRRLSICSTTFRWKCVNSDIVNIRLIILFVLDFLLEHGKRYLGELSIGEAKDLISSLVGNQDDHSLVRFLNGLRIKNIHNVCYDGNGGYWLDHDRITTGIP